MSASRHITWENFQSNYIEPGDPAVEVIPGSPHVEIFVERRGSCLGIRISHDDIPDISRILLDAISIEHRVKDDRLYLEIFTEDKALYEAFYAMATTVADLVQLEGREGVEAVRIAADRFTSLLRLRTLMPEEKRIGLWGELWALNRLLAGRGAGGLDAWTGPRDEPHDFRIGEYEVEVKTTRSNEREHVISSIQQLDSSPGKKLYVLSLQLGLGGSDSGLTLGEAISGVDNLLKGYPDRQEEFKSLIESLGCRTSDLPYYPDRFVLRTYAVMIPVDLNFPRISRDLLDKALGSSRQARIRDVHYRVNLEGMDYGDGDAVFQKLFV